MGSTMEEENGSNKLRHHIVLVHGLCHGAWCWYKVATALESAGHRVTVLDLPGADEVPSFEEYSRPLLRAMAAAPPGEKAVLVGHSFGGHNLALAMEAHPEKIAVAVFVSAPMPVAGHPMSAIMEQVSQTPYAIYMQCDHFLYRGLPAQMFLGDEAMTGEEVLTEERYGAVSRVFVVAEEDKMWTAEEQRRVAASGGPGVEMRAIAGADHMLMFSKPAELAKLIMEIAEQHSEESRLDGGGKHFILVHGLCHGAWSWYKVATLLRAAGHRVTALDLAAAGAHPARLDEVRSFEEYSRPLLDAVAAAGDGEGLILVGHSHGGLSIALAMERFPRKVAAAVFVDAAMPWVGKHMGVTTEGACSWTAKWCQSRAAAIRTNSGVAMVMGPRFMEQKYNQSPAEPIKSSSDKDNSGVAMVMGPRFMEQKYNQSPAEDLTLAKLLVRPGNQFLDDPAMKDEALLTASNYGSVRKVFVAAKADGSSTEEMTRWIVGTNPGTEVEKIAGADHFVMNSKPRELCDVLLRIANKYD
ncbi:hypothetical protein HU200_009454 [Digitaria exilis]|uniref:AB hydrolase-1 domain-containing protein n=1 Tax=Digitaria exilis TaxID=1010633 RepID=A0A835FJK6_9POAL|nr:hypothetical protein HU200_009454 [Digitaria exilis]